jgi:3-hydroxyisobutyrate dehydrogenase
VATPGTVLVDMTTSRPDLAVRIAQQAAAAGLHSLDAPVTGGDVGARNGTLSIMVGGDAAAVEAVRPCLSALGTTIVHHGGPGSGQHTKLVNQMLIAGTMTAISEALVYAQRAGLQVDDVLSSVSAGAAGSWSLTNLAPRMLRGDFAPGFFVDHFVKDMAIGLEEASRLRLSLPGLALAHQLYVALQARGRGTDGTQALVHALAALSDVEWVTKPDS